MKKFFSILTAAICVIACAFSLTACGDNSNTEKPDDNDNNTQTVAVTSVTLNKSTLTLDIGDEETLTATVKPDNATNKTVTWASDKPAIASVTSGGKVTAKADGTAIITATADGKSDTCTVTVNKAITPPDGDTTPVATVTLNKNSLTLDINDTETLTATVKPDNAKNKTVTWTSDKPAIVSVDNGGKVTAKTDGTAIITATADGKSDTCTVTVNKVTQTVEPNKYAEIVAALKTRVRQESKYADGEIVMIYEDGGLLCCKVKTSSCLYGLKTMVSTKDNSLTAENINTAYYTTAIANNPKFAQILRMSNGFYHTDGTAEQIETVHKMIAKLLGDGYKIMYGTISGTSDRGTIEGLGNSAQFTIDALLEKDGRLFSYSETLTVTKDLGDVYQAVLKSTESNKDYIYKRSNTAPNDLGDVAANYLAEEKRVSAAQN